MSNCLNSGPRICSKGVNKFWRWFLNHSLVPLAKNYLPHFRRSLSKLIILQYCRTSSIYPYNSSSMIGFILQDEYFLKCHLINLCVFKWLPLFGFSENLYMQDRSIAVSKYPTIQPNNICGKNAGQLGVLRIE